MDMLMMRIVPVGVLVLKGDVFVLMLVPLCQMQPKTGSHQPACREQLRREWLI